jgi:predicted lipoprotein with Yx(FWY)xxD motif/plastocyanin
MTSGHRTSRRHAPRRLPIGAGLLASAALVVGACSAAATPASTAAPTAGSSPASTAAASPGAAATVKTATHSLGTYLTGPEGKALYLFTKDSKDASNCSGQCATNWPPLTVAGSAAPSGDTGVSGTLATITRADGALQVTYNGIPLYYFAKDVAPGDTNGQGVNDVWYLVGPNSTAASGTISGGLGQSGGSTQPPAGSGSATRAEIKGFAFPSTIEVAAGQTVTWVNLDTEAHTVTADDGSFKSENLAKDATFQHTFSSAATVRYHCELHPNMTGTVTVSSAANVTY